MKAESSDNFIWLKAKLAEAMGFAGTEEIANYVLSMPTAFNQEQYLMEMLDMSNSNHASFIEEFRAKMGPPQQKQGPKGVKVYRKADETEDYFSAPVKKNVGGQKNSNTISNQSQIKTSSFEVNENTGNIPSQKGDCQFKELIPLTRNQPTKSKKGKIASSQINTVTNSVQIEGRRSCNCQATKHDLINNCTACGKVVCKQEGSGPCLFCGAIVCTKEEQEVLNRGSKKSEQLRKKLMDVDVNSSKWSKDDCSSAGRDKAEAQKNRLLEYDRTSEKRTKVIDDESDYFSVDAYKWMTPEQKSKLKEKEKELREKRHGSRLDRKIDFDFAGRRIVEAESEFSKLNLAEDEIIKSVYEGSNSSNYTSSTSVIRSDGGNANDNSVANPYTNIPRPQLVEAMFLENSGFSAKSTFSKHADEITKNYKFRLQDKQLQEMSDHGMCLSMHQPYASYLVAGIKIHEGRTWYSPHRGRLWIHAASKQPTDQEVEDLQTFYKHIYGGNISFPVNLPTSCLLGCVDVEDVLPQEEYRELYPKGESGSPYVFVCSNPQELLVKFPMQGQHKIYKLDSNIHNAAKKSAKKAKV